jgi:hypothetical protein
LITLKLLSLAAHPINRADDWPYSAPDAKSPAWAGRAPRQQVPLERFLHTYLDPDVRSLPWYFALLLVVAIALPARAATLASSGTIDVASNTKVLVIATDPVLQEVLSDDFGVARRSKTTGGPKMLTLTVALIQRVLQPGISMMELAPGVPGVAKLVKAAGYLPPSEGTNEPLTGDAAEYVAQGRPSTTAYGNGSMGNSYQRDPLTGQLNQLSAYSKGPPSAPDPRDPVNRAIDPPDYLKPHAESLYDTALIAHAVLSDGKGDMTVVAVAHPNEDLDTVKKQLAERIANAVLH